MRLKEYDFDPVDVDADGIAASQTPAAGGVQSLNLNGALTSGGVYTADVGGRRLVLTAVANESARTFEVTGTDPDGYPITDSLAGPNATIVESVEYFRTVTDITTDDDTAGAITVGTVDEISSKSIPLDWRSDIAATINADITGTINYSVQQTFDDVLRGASAPRSAHQNSQWVAIGTTGVLTAADADQRDLTTVGATAIRVLINSYSSGAELQVNLNQTSSKY